MARKKLLLGNWKMNKTPSEAKAFALCSKEMVEFAVSHGIDVGVAPTFVCLDAVVSNADKKLIIAAQNCNEHDHGAYTGEISIPMLKEVGVSWVILGHSERRTYNGETSIACNAKIKALLAADMTPVYCCGESLETFESGETKAWVAKQIEEGFAGLSEDDAEKVVVAYEPIWAIGTGKNATKEIAEDTIASIRAVLKKMFGEESAEKIRILYGGSVKPNNIAEYMSEKDIDGALVGGASLELDSYKGLIENLVK
jgi:triosephosphate isomerase (TIM)